MRTAGTSRVGKRSGSSAGFTLVELMIVVAMIGILAAFAVASFSRNQTQNDADTWIRTNRDAILVASRKAVATRTPYMVEFTATTVQWCQVVVVGAAPTYAGTQTTCVGLAATVDQGPLQDATARDTRTVFFANVAELPDAAGNGTTAVRSVIGSGTRLYFGLNGSASTNVKNVMTAGLPDLTVPGFTLYTRRRMADDTQYRRRLAVISATGRTRVIDNY